MFSRWIRLSELRKRQEWNCAVLLLCILGFFSVKLVLRVFGVRFEQMSDVVHHGIKADHCNDEIPGAT